MVVFSYHTQRTHIYRHWYQHPNGQQPWFESRRMRVTFGIDCWSGRGDFGVGWGRMQGRSRSGSGCNSSGFETFRFAGERCRNDREIVLLAFELVDRLDAMDLLLQYLGSQARRDPEICLAAAFALDRLLEGLSKVAGHGPFLMESFQRWALFVGDMGLPGALAAVRHKGVLLGFVWPHVCVDDYVEVAIVAVRQNGLALRFVRPPYNGHHAIVLEAVRQNAASLAFAHASLRYDEEILAEVRRKRSRA